MDKTNFIKVKEDFICLNCGKKVKGSGYTNHCPKCLYSLHVDKEVPGDRKSDCLGLMKPIGVDKKGDKFIIIHECVKCGKKMKNKVSVDDDFEMVVGLISKE
jgi:DNA-directed RNA polymerase subunit RPC12/RpoP